MAVLASRPAIAIAARSASRPWLRAHGCRPASPLPTLRRPAKSLSDPCPPTATAQPGLFGQTASHFNPPPGAGPTPPIFRKNRVVPFHRVTIMSRMKVPHDSFVDSRDFARIAQAICFIDDHFREQPRLTTIAAQAGLSEFHFNRMFRRWAGVTPKQYLAFVTGREARGEIAGRSSSVLDAAYAVGLSGPGRLHDLIVTLDAVTPGELKVLGRGITVHYGFSETPFGDALFATTPRGLCHLAFVETGVREKAVSELRDR